MKMWLMMLLAVIPTGVQAQDGAGAPAVPLPPVPVEAPEGPADEVVPAETVPEEVVPAPEPEKPVKRVFGKSDEESYAGKVVVLKVGERDLMNKQSFKFMRRTLRRADDEGAAAVVFDIHTPGGLAWDTSELMMDEMANLKVDSFAFVNSKAMSAGALISVATDRIYMKPVSAIGAAALVAGNGQEIPKEMRAKMESAYDAFVRSVVKKKGHNINVVRAMMFMEQEHWFDEVKVPRDKLLTLTADEAVGEFEGKPLLAAGIVDDVEGLLKAEGLEEKTVVNAEPTGFERLAWWVRALSPVLILVGLGAGYLEMKAPGFGLGGGISLLAFGLFFFGNYAAGNLAGYELAGLFVLGIVLILVELFVAPGTLVAGILGIIAVMSALFLAMVDRFDFEAIEADGISVDGLVKTISYPSLSLALGLIGAMILILLLMRYLPRIPYFGGLLLKKQLESGAAMDEEVTVSGSIPVESRVGWTGEAVTDLRPAGKAEFDGEVLDVTTEGAFVEQGGKVRIVSESGMGVVVKGV